MRIALFSKAFLPNVGGIETSSAMIARIWQRAGHEVEVVTAVPDAALSAERYPVTRTWTLASLKAAATRADVLVTNGYSRLAVAVAALTIRRLIIFHQGYQLICSDGLGFRDRRFHDFALSKDLKLAFRAGPRTGVKALLRIPFDAVTRAWPLGIRHVVPSQHVASRLGLSRYDIVYQPPSPSVIDGIAKLGASTMEAERTAFETGEIVFLGRLVFEKGCDDLIRAYAIWRQRQSSVAGGRNAPARLVIYGQGPERPAIERLVRDLGLDRDVDLRPFLSGGDLVRAARAASVVVIPSRWEEPGATIAVELFACGAAVIVSQSGAPGEIFLRHGRLFPNGDVEALSRAIGEHFQDGPIRPRPSGGEPWTLPVIQTKLIGLLHP